MREAEAVAAAVDPLEVVHCAPTRSWSLADCLRRMLHAGVLADVNHVLTLSKPLYGVTATHACRWLSCFVAMGRLVMDAGLIDKTESSLHFAVMSPEFSCGCPRCATLRGLGAIVIN